MKFVYHNYAMALLMSASDFPEAMAFSIRASEMASLDFNDNNSFDIGIPSFLAISLTFTWLAAFTDSVEVWLIWTFWVDET